MRLELSWRAAASPHQSWKFEKPHSHRAQDFRIIHRWNNFGVYMWKEINRGANLRLHGHVRVIGVIGFRAKIALLQLPVIHPLLPSSLFLLIPSFTPCKFNFIPGLTSNLPNRYFRICSGTISICLYICMDLFICVYTHTWFRNWIRMNSFVKWRWRHLLSISMRWNRKLTTHLYERFHSSTRII